MLSPRGAAGAARSLAAAAALVTLGYCLGVAAEQGAQAPRTLNDAVYSKDQARAGKKLYKQYCISCHERGYFRQVLMMRKGETLRPLFEAMVALMPQNAPGSLSDAQYIDLIAYIVAEERYAPGEGDLAVANLDAIVIPEAD